MNQNVTDTAGPGLAAMIISASLMIGVITFAVIVIFVIQPRQPLADGALPLITLCSAGFAAAAIVGNFLVGQKHRAQAVRSLATGQLKPAANSPVTTTDGILAARFTTQMIIRAALLEGAAFFSIIAYMIEGHWWALAILAVLIALMAINFATPRRLQQWTAGVARDAQDQAQLMT